MFAAGISKVTLFQRSYRNTHQYHDRHVIEKLERLQTHRLHDPDRELDRLNQNLFVQQRLAQLVDCNLSEGASLPSVHHRVALGRSFEIHDMIKDTHYVLHHAQSGWGYLILNILMKSLLANSSRFLEFQTVLRYPQQNADLRNVAWYKKVLNDSDANDHTFSRELVSADLHLASRALGESALDIFLNYHANIKSLQCQALLNEMVSAWSQNEELKSELIEKLKKIMSSIQSSEGHHQGMLYTICVPKYYFHECAYLCEMLGKPFIPDMDQDVMIAAMQHEVSLNKRFPQARLVTSKLNENIPIFSFPAISDQLISRIWLKRQ